MFLRTPIDKKKFSAQGDQKLETDSYNLGAAGTGASNVSPRRLDFPTFPINWGDGTRNNPILPIEPETPGAQYKTEIWLQI